MADISASNWNEADASNSAAAPDGAPEGMAPSGLNDVLRAHQGAIKRWYDWTIPKTTGGTSTAYTLSYSVAPGALVDGMTHLVQFHTANGNAPTLNVNALGAIPLQYYSSGAWRAVPANLFDTDTICPVAYTAAAGAYRLLMVGRGETGDVIPTARSTAPAGHLMCYGQAISRTAYAGLFAALGGQYGTGDGSTTFNLPDLRGRVAAGKDDMGGSAANRITGTTVPNSPVLGATGGSQTETASLTGSTSGALGVSVTGTTGPPDQTQGTSGSDNQSATINHAHNFTGTGITSGLLPVTGTTAAATNVQPTIILNQMIRI
jgi:microcystin-dependent protein